MLRSIEAVERCGVERRSVRAANREQEGAEALESERRCESTKTKLRVMYQRRDCHYHSSAVNVPLDVRRSFIQAEGTAKGG